MLLFHISHIDSPSFLFQVFGKEQAPVEVLDGKGTRMRRSIILLLLFELSPKCQLDVMTNVDMWFYSHFTDMLNGYHVKFDPKAL